MSKKKQLNLLDLPQTNFSSPSISKNYINPLTGEVITQPEISFNELIDEVSVKYSREVTPLSVSLVTSQAGDGINGSTLIATFYPFTPIISFNTAIPDYVRFNIVLSLTDDFEKSAVISNVSFYPSTTLADSEVGTFTESAKVSSSLYLAALHQLFRQYSLEEYLATLPDSSEPYSSGDFTAMIAHFYERAELTRVYIRVQLNSFKNSTLVGEPVTYSSKTGWINIGVISLDTGFVQLVVSSPAYEPPYVYRSIRANAVRDYVYKLDILNKTHYITTSIGAGGYSTFLVHPLNFTTLADYTNASLSLANTTLYDLTFTKFRTTYGVTVDLSFLDKNSQEYRDILSRYGSVTSYLNTPPIDAGWPTHVVPRYVSNSYTIDNLSTTPVLKLHGMTYIGTLDIFGQFPAITDPLLPQTPRGAYSLMLAVTKGNSTYTANRTAEALFTRFNSTPSPYSSIRFTPLVNRSPGVASLYGFAIEVPITQETGLINGFDRIDLWTRKASLNFEYKTLSTMGDRRRPWLPNLPAFQVSKGVIKEFTLAKTALKKVKTSVLIAIDAGKTRIPFMPNCKVYLRRYVYSKVGKTVTYTPGSFLLSGILTKNEDGTLRITDAQGNPLTYNGAAFSKNDELRLLADFKNLQDFYGIRQLLSTCDEKNYIEIARVKV